MKVLFVLENYFPFIGGAEVLFKNLCEGLVAKGYEVTVITSSLPQAPYNEMVNGVQVLRVQTPRKGSRYWFTFMAIPQALKRVKKFDIVQTTTYNGAFPAWLAAGLAGKKCIITVHEIIGSGWKDMQGMNTLTAWLHRFLEWVIVALPFNRYMTVSQYTAKQLEKYHISPKKISTSYNGIDYDFFNIAKADRPAIREMLGLKDNFVYMYFGRPGISKGVEYLVAAVPLISREIPDARLLLLMGKEPAEGFKKILALVKEMQIEARVLVHDPVPRIELPGYVAAADCVVVPSITEGFGFTAAEACAMDRPVVVSNVGSLPEIVSGTYVMVGPRDAAAIADGVIRIHRGEAITSEKKHFYWASCIDNYDKIYRQETGNS
ncbi:MAG: glycosyltransferase family 4 protein [Dehalococcoidia bacterium]|jgi:glycosyltransferase involved in cell wall biosynthesis